MTLEEMEEALENQMAQLDIEPVDSARYLEEVPASLEDFQQSDGPIPLRNVNGTLNEAGSVTEVVDLVLRYKNHSEHALFAVTSLGSQNLIMGHTWLRKHNQEIDWITREVEMSCCSGSCCSGC